MKFILQARKYAQILGCNLSTKVAILASGTGTNAEAVLEYAEAHPEFYQVVGVISNKRDAAVLAKAEKYSMPAIHIPHRDQSEQIQQLEAWSAQWACLAGYMRIVTSDFLRFFFDEERGYARVINIHPSLLPRFPGLDAYGQAFASGESESGITVHLVDEKMDHGPILLQKSFPRNEDDDLEAFMARGRAIENSLYVEALVGLLKGEIQPRAQGKTVARKN